MDTAIIASLISLVGSLAGTFAGIYASSKLTLYRIEQLEKKVDRFAVIEEKLHELELHNAVQDQRTENISETIKDIREEVGGA